MVNEGGRGILPEGESLRRALRWLDERIREDPTLDRMKLVGEASRHHESRARGGGVSPAAVGQRRVIDKARAVGLAPALRGGQDRRAAPTHRPHLNGRARAGAGTYA